MASPLNLLFLTSLLVTIFMGLGGHTHAFINWLLVTTTLALLNVFETT